jgi:hypothetical protein
MIKAILKKKAGRPKKAGSVLVSPEVEEPTPVTPTPAETKPVLPIIDGIQAIEVIAENENATHYRLANGTTTWASKK